MPGGRPLAAGAEVAVSGTARNFQEFGKKVVVFVGFVLEYSNELEYPQQAVLVDPNTAFLVKK